MKSCILKVIDLCSKGSEEGTVGGAEANIDAHAPIARARCEGASFHASRIQTQRHTGCRHYAFFVLWLLGRCCCQDIYIIATELETDRDHGSASEI